MSEAYRDYLVESYISEKMKKDILSKAEIIPNGIDDFWFKNKGTIRQLLNEYKKIVYYRSYKLRRERYWSF